MKFTLSQIRKSAVNGPFTFEQNVNVSELVQQNNDIRKITDVNVKGVCYLEKQNIFFDFTIAGDLILPCARTLIDVPYNLQVNVTEVFTTSQYYTEEDEENEIHQVTDEVIDLTPYIKENIILNIPYRVFSNEKMIDNGEGWSYYIEDEQHEVEDSSEQKIDPRLKKLQQFLDNRENKEK